MHSSRPDLTSYDPLRYVPCCSVYSGLHIFKIRLSARLSSVSKVPFHDAESPDSRISRSWRIPGDEVIHWGLSTHSHQTDSPDSPFDHSWSLSFCTSRTPARDPFRIGQKFRVATPMCVILVFFAVWYSHYSFEAGSRTAEEEGRSLLGLFLT